jgi:hypothetical protein
VRQRRKPAGQAGGLLQAGGPVLMMQVHQGRQTDGSRHPRGWGEATVKPSVS